MPIVTRYASDPNQSLLTYSLATSPAPLQVSPAGTPSIGALTIVVSCPDSVGSVTISKVIVKLPIGDPNAPDATDLTETATGISPSVYSPGPVIWRFEAGAEAGTFDLTPVSGIPVTVESQGLTLSLTGIQVAPLVGTAIVEIFEFSPSGGPSDTRRTCRIAVAKFPYRYIAGNFAAEKAMVANDDPVTLSWVGSVGPRYTLTWDNKSADVTNVRRWTSPKLTDVTTFILAVEYQEAGQTVKLEFSLTVTVDTPDITANRLTVLKDTTTDTLKVVTVEGDVVFKGKVTFEGEVTFNGKAVFQKDTTHNATAAFNGEANFAGAGFSGAVVFQQVATHNALASFNAQVDFYKTINVSDRMLLGNQWFAFCDQGSKDLIFMNNANQQQICMQPNGAMFSRSGGKSTNFFRSGDSCSIKNPYRKALLNATEKIGKGSGADNWVATTYWKDERNKDPDTDLEIRWGKSYEEQG